MRHQREEARTGARAGRRHEKGGLLAEKRQAELANAPQSVGRLLPHQEGQVGLLAGLRHGPLRHSVLQHRQPRDGNQQQGPGQRQALHVRRGPKLDAPAADHHRARRTHHHSNTAAGRGVQPHRIRPRP